MSKCKKDLRYEMYEKALERNQGKENSIVKKYKKLWEKAK